MTALLRRALWLVAATLAYNLIEAGVSVWAGTRAGSIALLSFGLDSVIECAASAVLIWRLVVEVHGADAERVETAERRSARFIGATFFALAIYVLVESVLTLTLGDHPASSPVGIILAAVVGGLLAQGPIHKAVLGTDAGNTFGGLDPVVLAAFVILFVLGFLMYSLLYAALGSLVSRQEDVQSATSPLMMLIIAGYVMSVFGLQAIDDTWVKIASFVPFFSPYLMLARVSMGHVEAWEFGLAVLLLVISIAVALFVAARIYSAGVLLYGQRLSLRQVLSAARVSR